jgi:hypothetical protein
VEKLVVAVGQAREAFTPLPQILGPALMPGSWPSSAENHEVCIRSTRHECRAYYRLTAGNDRKRSWFQKLIRENTNPLRTPPTIVILTRRAATVSGWLPDANSLHDLHGAVAHFRTLLASDVVTVEDWKYATAEFIGKLIDWGDTYTQHEWN